MQPANGKVRTVTVREFRLVEPTSRVQFPTKNDNANDHVINRGKRVLSQEGTALEEATRRYLMEETVERMIVRGETQPQYLNSKCLAIGGALQISSTNLRVRVKR